MKNPFHLLVIADSMKIKINSYKNLDFPFSYFSVIFLYFHFYSPIPNHQTSLKNCKI